MNYECRIYAFTEEKEVMFRKKMIICSFIAALLIPCSVDAGIGGYSWSEPYKYPSGTVPIAFGGLNLNTTYSQAAMTSINAWSNIDGINISITAGTENKFYVSSYADAWYWLTTIMHDGEDITKYTIKINSGKIDSDFPSNKYKAARSVFAHELGHVLGLDDLGGYENVNISIMKHNRDRTVVYTPTGLDIHRVRLLYDLI